MHDDKSEKEGNIMGNLDIGWKNIAHPFGHFKNLSFKKFHFFQLYV